MSLNVALNLSTGHGLKTDNPPVEFILTEAVAADKVLLETVVVSKLGLETI
jgi:hypothetical protein